MSIPFSCIISLSGFLTRAAPAAAKQRNAFLDLLKLATAATMEAAQQGIFEANLHRQENLTGHWENLWSRYIMVYIAISSAITL